MPLLSLGAGMRRREFLGVIGGAAAAWPVAARAQQPTLRRVGALILGNADAQAFSKELREGLRKNGYVEGQNIDMFFARPTTMPRYYQSSRLRLVALKVDVIIALFTPCSLAAQQATREFRLSPCQETLSD